MYMRTVTWCKQDSKQTAQRKISQAIKQKVRMLTDISCRFICSVASEVLMSSGVGRRHARRDRSPRQPTSCHTTAERERRGLNDLRVLKNFTRLTTAVYINNIDWECSVASLSVVLVMTLLRNYHLSCLLDKLWCQGWTRETD